MAQAMPNPWAFLVLSLDGGGVRGLSSLYILREIMDEIQTLDNAGIPNNQIEQGPGVPLPCNYFDFIIGTSTGGIIAIMLGRLRMSVDECIEQYWRLANKIFIPHKTRLIQYYSRRKVEKAAVDVVKQFCHCHPNHADCTGKESLRQYDYIEQGNRTCKVALMTVREGGHTTHATANPVDVPILFRSYDHSPRLHYDAERNPRTLQGSKLFIAQACQCTTAAPTYFKSVQLYGRKYIDGGVIANNPALEAWNEGIYMANPTELGRPRLPKLLLSIGTGMPREHSRFGMKSLALGTLQKITDTRTAHDAMLGIRQTRPELEYFRLDVPGDPHHPQRGLSDIGLDQCRKKRMSNPYPNMPIPGDPANIVQRFEQRDWQLRQNASENTKGGYKPNKYRYVTFDKIRDRTATYCNTVGARNDIQNCARILQDQSIQRRNDNQGRWTEFRNHPDPNHT